MLKTIFHRKTVIVKELQKLAKCLVRNIVAYWIQTQLAQFKCCCVLSKLAKSRFLLDLLVCAKRFESSYFTHIPYLFLTCTSKKKHLCSAKNECLSSA